ncbi:MAG: hypothetical protein ACI9EQ_002117 [Bacteroidia bacterium]
MGTSYKLAPAGEFVNNTELSYTTERPIGYIQCSTQFFLLPQKGCFSLCNISQFPNQL